MTDYDSFLDRARAEHERRRPKTPDPEPPPRPIKPPAKFKYPAGGLVLDGRVVIYGVPHWFRGQQDIFLAGCFKGSLDMVWMGCDHKYFERPLGRQEDDSLELHDDDVALSFRLKLSADALQRLDGRSEASAAYAVHSSEIIKGIRHIRRATLLEISAVHVGSLRQTHCYVRDASTVGTLEADSKTRFANDGAFTKVIAALRKLEHQ